MFIRNESAEEIENRKSAVLASFKEVGRVVATHDLSLRNDNHGMPVLQATYERGGRTSEYKIEVMPPSWVAQTFKLDGNAARIKVTQTSGQSLEPKRSKRFHISRDYGDNDSCYFKEEPLAVIQWIQKQHNL